MFTFRTRFLFNVSLNNGKIELVCPQVVWDGGAIFSLLILYLKLQPSATLLPGVGGTCCLHLPVYESGKRRKL